MPANAAKQQALKQTQAFASRPGKHVLFGPARCQPSSISEESLPGNIAWVVISNDNAPLLLWHRARPSLDLAGGADLFARLVASTYVGARGAYWYERLASTKLGGAGVRWIG